METFAVAEDDPTTPTQKYDSIEDPEISSDFKRPPY